MLLPNTKENEEERSSTLTVASAVVVVTNRTTRTDTVSIIRFYLRDETTKVKRAKDQIRDDENLKMSGG